ncbi:MAG: TatD family hydrolase, partial [Candidatus Nanoarchaeia archaeon]
EYPDFLFPAFGVHPEYAHIIDKEQLKEELKWIKKQKPVCIGEIGLDRFWIKKVLKPHQQNRAWQSQINLFECFITLAKELKIPLNVHSRWATRDVLDILDKYKPEKVILHAFSGNLNEAKEAIDKGYFISLGTNILYSEQKRDLVKHLNLTNLLLETDSPVLGPEKGKRNEPKNIVYVIRELSLLKKIAEEKIIEVTNENVMRLFFD